MDLIVPLLAAMAAFALGLAAALWLGRRRNDGERRAEQGLAEMAGRLEQLGQSLHAAHSEMNARLQAQERALSETLSARLGDHAQHTGQVLNAVNERLAVIDRAQKNLTDLSNQMVALQDILGNKQARGRFGEFRLSDLVTDALPQSAYVFQARLSSGVQPDCLIKLPNPPGPLAIDAKFPLEGYRLMHEAETELARKEAAREFVRDVAQHVKDIAAKYIVPGETAEWALLFLPSDAVYTELQVNFPAVVEEALRNRVGIVSPTTLWATLTTVRAVLKDARIREQAHLIQGEVHRLMEDVARLDKRVENLQGHFRMAGRDIEEIVVSSRKITARGEKIDALELAEEPEPGQLDAPDDDIGEQP